MGKTSPVFRIFIVAVTLIPAVAIAFADVSTRFLPEVTVFVLIPVIAGTYYLGFRYGLVVTLFAAASELVAHLMLEEGAQHTVVIADAASHTFISVFTAALIASLVTQLRKITRLQELRDNDLDIAKRVHGSVFAAVPASYKNLSIGIKVAFARELGGDYYYISGLDEKLFFCIADISGKSTAAALFTALLNQSVAEGLEHTLDLTALVMRVNSRINSVLPEDMFVTMFCAFMEEDSVAYVNAGHPPPLLYSKKEGTVKTLRSSHVLPIGIEPDLKIDVATETFEPDDVLLAATDGITENSAFKDRPYERLRELLYQNSNAEAQEIADIVFAKAVPSSVESLPDDAIVVCIKRH